MARRRHAWELMHRDDLPPEKRKLAQRYYEIMENYFRAYQDIKRELFGRKD